ncbi:hypothetical protein [Salinarchaeum chitinilyticum]
MFYVLTGTLVVEIRADYEVPPCQFFVAEPGSPHRAHVPADADRAVTTLGMVHRHRATGIRTNGRSNVDRWSPIGGCPLDVVVVLRLWSS